MYIQLLGEEIDKEMGIGMSLLQTFSISLSRPRFVPREPAGTEDVLSSLPRPDPISEKAFRFLEAALGLLTDFGAF